MNENKLSIKIKNSILNDFKNNEKKGIYALNQKIIAYNSNRIEGSTLTLEQTASLFDTGVLVSNGIEIYKAKDIEEMNGHFKMFNELLKNIDKPLSIDLIKAFHYQLKSGVFEDMLNGYPVGEFKNRPNIVSDIKTITPDRVEEELKILLSNYSNLTMNIEDIAVFHAKYELIHPFQDGNGRTGRMIILKQCFDNELVPIIIKDDSKAIYYKALNIAQKDNDYKMLIDYFEKCQTEYLDYIKDFVE